MKSKHHNFHDPRYSMLLSGINDYVKKEAKGVKGMNAKHEMVTAMSRVIEKRTAAEGGLIHRISQLLTKLLLFFKKDKKGVLDDCMEILLEYKLLKLAGLDAKADEKKEELKFSQCDPKWVEAVLVWIDAYVIHHDKPSYAKYKQLDDFAYDIPDKDLKVGLIADWGTGEEQAELVLDQLFAQQPDIILHLGDIYYSGTEEEYQDNYLDVIEKCRKKHGVNTPVYNLPGNHDYYSGGQPFYDFLSKTNSQASDYPQQEASYFVLGNSSWQLQGMDTGHNDRNVFEVGKDITHLQSKEVTWHHHHLDKGLASDKRILLFSHHQLFSRFLNIGKISHNKHLLKHFDKYLDKVSGWFWGHEHLLEIYKPFLGLEKGRCIGNGAVPIIYDEGNPYRATAKYKGSPISPIPDIIPESVVDNNGDIYANGFVMLDLKVNKEGKAFYYSILPDEELKLVHQEEL